MRGAPSGAVAAELPPPPLWVRAAGAVVRRLPAGRYRAMALLPRRAAPFAGRLAPELGGARFRCDLGDDIAREVCFTGRYGPQETALVRALLGPGETFVDVGANWGYFSLVAAHRAGRRGRVVAMEPDPRLFPLLRGNLAGAGAHATALAVAAADRPGPLTLAGFAEESGNRGVSSIVAGERSGAARFAVAGGCVDDVLDAEGIGRVDLLKLDVEGAEVLALRGMERGLAAHRYRRLLVELHPLHGPVAAPAAELLRGAGYTGWTVDHSPEATRRAAYGHTPDAASFVRPLAGAAAGDAWPHQLWAAPGEEPPFAR